MPTVTKTLLAAAALLVATSTAAAEPRTEYRGFWVDTFNTTLNNHADVVAVVNNAKAAKANVLFVQVRRRGDAWYLRSLEPLPDTVPIAPGFDPLDDIIQEAHANGIEVHAFVIMSAIWSRLPSVGGPPTHVFKLHGGYDPATNTIVPGPDNWLTRTLLANPTGVTFQGHRFGNDFWLDFGHPAAAAYTVDVLMHLVRNYSIDGLHLDRIRYPEIGIAGQTPSTGTNIGYNTTSVERFQRRHGIAVGSPPPAQNDPLWNQWRRDQVTNVVRRLYLNAIAEKPKLILSGALIVFGGGPATEAAWNSAEAYWRVYQDWRAWTEEGILDLAIPMNYKREHIAAQLAQYDSWNEWTKNHQYNRGALMGPGASLNSVEGTIRQTRRALAPSAMGMSLLGVNYFSMATSDAAVTANPLSIPPGQNTPDRPFAELASGLTTGKSVNGLVAYEDVVANPLPIFTDPATIPVLPWKVSPTKGHIMGFARRPDNTVLDTADVAIASVPAATGRNTATDGGGFYGGVDLMPGTYLVRAQLNADVLYSCLTNVYAGKVSTADLRSELKAPETAAVPAQIAGWYRSDVTVGFSAADDCTGIERTEYSLNGGTSWQPATAPFAVTAEGITTILYRSVDRAGNIEPAKTLVVRIDKSSPSLTLTADPSLIWPANGKMVTVEISGAASDAVSGLASVAYVVTDEYGAPLAIPARSLSGAAAKWKDRITVEARREGGDKDGRLYRIVATVTDVAGNTSTATVNAIVPHDQRPE